METLHTLKETISAYSQHGCNKLCEGIALLHIAVLSNQRESVEYLLAKGCPTDTGDQDGETPLHYACRYDYSDIVSVLLEHSADVNGMDNIGNQPLHVAALHRSVASVNMLIAHGADIDATNQNGITPLMFGVHDKDIREELMAQGANIMHLSNHGDSMLHYAVTCEDSEYVARLLKAGLSKEIRNSENLTAADLLRNRTDEVALRMLRVLEPRNLVMGGNSE